MISSDGNTIMCDGPECDAVIQNHQWGKTKAEGWVFLQTGATFCPDDVPPWYEEWKERRANA